MLQIDLGRIQSGSMTLFSATDAAYLIFLCIGVVGYFTVPGIGSQLVAARGIYRAAGFRLVSTEPHRDFGPPMVGEEWELEL